MAQEGEKPNQLAEATKKVFRRHGARYGAPRLVKELVAKDWSVSERTVGRIMRSLGLRSKSGLKYRHPTTKRSSTEVIHPNTLDRQFKVEKPNPVWVGDITYLVMKEGWLYLAVMIDLFSRKVIGWKTSTSVDQYLVSDALESSLKNRGYPKGMMVHTDQGSQYGAKSFVQMMAKNELKGSMSRKGNCWDNAVAESFLASLKKECIYSLGNITREQMKWRVFEYIDGYYNSIRRHSHNRGQSPIKFEAQYQHQSHHLD